MRRQMRYFFARIDEVEAMNGRLQALVPETLHRIISDLIRYCRIRGATGSKYYDRFEKKIAVRLFAWFAISTMNHNQTARIQTYINDCEDWLDIAVMTLSL
jgi:hypothetical protein